MNRSTSFSTKGSASLKRVLLRRSGKTNSFSQNNMCFFKTAELCFGEAGRTCFCILVTSYTLGHLVFSHPSNFLSQHWPGTLHVGPMAASCKRPAVFEDILSCGRFPFHTSVPKPGEREASVASVNNFTCYLLSIRLSLVLEDETS